MPSTKNKGRKGRKTLSFGSKVTKKERRYRDSRRRTHAKKQLETDPSAIDRATVSRIQSSLETGDLAGASGALVNANALAVTEAEGAKSAAEGQPLDMVPAQVFTLVAQNEHKSSLDVQAKAEEDAASNARYHACVTAGAAEKKKDPKYRAMRERNDFLRKHPRAPRLSATGDGREADRSGSASLEEVLATPMREHESRDHRKGPRPNKTYLGDNMYRIKGGVSHYHMDGVWPDTASCAAAWAKYNYGGRYSDASLGDYGGAPKKKRDRSQSRALSRG